MKPTPYPALNQLLHDFVADLQVILADRLIGFYLQGSFAVGDFDDHSDVDFIVIIASELIPDQLTRLQTMHQRLYRYETHWAQHLEGSYMPQLIMKRPLSPGQTYWYLDNGSQELVRSDHCNTLVVRWTMRQHGVTLIGPDPHTVIPPVSPAALKTEIRQDMIDWGQEILDNPDRFNNRFYQAFITLNYCRMLQSLHTGAITSKRAGADWARQHLDPAWHGLIDRTWSGRPDPAWQVRQPADPADYAATLDFVRHTIDLARHIPVVQLRNVADSDLPLFFQQQLDPEANWMAAFTHPDPTDEIAFMAHWDKIRRSPTVSIQTILVDEAIAGSVLCYEQAGETEVSYWLGQEFWGRGIATQALAEFLHQVEKRPLFARVAKDNIGSLRVLQKCGFVIIAADKGFANARNMEIEEYVLKLLANHIPPPSYSGK